MAEITASLVKELRERTGAGMMECKKALTENNGDLETSAEWLRKQGIIKVGKKADRVTAEGRIAMAQDGGKAVLVEINSETDFVAKDDNFLAFIDAQVPAHLDVHLVCDNYGTHKAPTVQTWVANHPRFHIHYTPTYSSWINQVERWFAELTRQLLERGDHRSVHALERDIRAWVADWNANPKPFVWTKTAEQILQSIHRLMTRINGAGH